MSKIIMKNLALNLPIETHMRLEKLIHRKNGDPSQMFKSTSKRAIATEALNIGLNALEGVLEELKSLQEETQA